MASSFVVSRNSGKLSRLLLGLQNSWCTWVRSLRMVRFLWQHLWAEGMRARCPEVSVSSPVAGIEIGVQCTCGVALIFFRRPLRWSQTVCILGSLVGCRTRRLLHKELVSLSGHAQPSGWSLGHGWLSPCNWHCSYGVQMSDSLLSSLMGELPSHLHLVASFFERLLEGYDLYYVASPGMYTHQLVGVT